MFVTSQLQRAPVTCAITCFALLLFAVGDWAQCISFQFCDFDGTQWLPVLACHCLHWSGEHLFWDVSVFFVLGTICEARLPCKFALALLTAGLAIPVCVLALHPQVQSYRGLSGLDTAIFSLLVGDQLISRFNERNWFQTLLLGSMLLAMTIKIAHEMLLGAQVFVHDDSFTPVPLAHVVGALIGLALCWYSPGGSTTTAVVC